MPGNCADFFSVFNSIENGVTGIGLDYRQRIDPDAGPILQPVLVTPQLSFDLVSRTIESQMCILGRMRTLEDNALHDMCDNVTAKAMNKRPLAEGDVSRQCPRKIFARNRLQPIVHMGAKCIAGIDLMPRNANFHA